MDKITQKTGKKCYGQTKSEVFRSQASSTPVLQTMQGLFREEIVNY